MVNSRTLFLVLGLCCLLLLAPLVRAESSAPAQTPEQAYVFDLAHVLEPTEIPKSNLLLKQFSEDNQQEVIFVTADDLGGKASRDFAADFFDELYPAEDASGAIILLDLENRELNLVTSGQLINVITDADEESLYDAAWPMLTAGNYPAMLEDMLDQLAFLLDRGVVPGHQLMSEKELPQPNRLTVTELIVSLVLSVLTGLGFYRSIQNRYRPETRKAFYHVDTNSILHLGAPLDRLINRQIRIIPLPAAQDSSTKDSKPYNPQTTSTTFRSSSGKTHGGGHGRKF